METNWYFLRATLESKSPLIIDSGDTDALSDTDPVRDANGLPMLPATTLAGVLRFAVGESNGKAWFGDQDGDTSIRSAVILTDGLFHWSDDKPHDGLVRAAANVESDDICKHVLPGQRVLTRDHVRLNEWGVVEGSGKFERDAVPTGARFTFELRTQNKNAFDALGAIIESGIFLGGATRTGYGEMACVSIGRETVELPSGWDRWCALMGADIGTSRGIAMTAPRPANAGQRVWTISGTIEGHLLVGTKKVLPKPEDGQSAPDRGPWAEPQFAWQQNKGQLKDAVFIVPGSAIKGPIRHRTLYHLRKTVPDAERAIETLFGKVASGDSGAAGLLRFHDCAVDADPKLVFQTHVGQDRFTGGPRRGVLFTDAALWKPKLTFKITEVQSEKITNAHRAALNLALNDMKTGLLGIGAEWGEGAGIFADAEVIGPREEAAHAA